VCIYISKKIIEFVVFDILAIELVYNYEMT
jgi:hypothetical protein